MVTHNQLVYLIEIVNQKSFTRAAEKLFLSQSTLSKSIKALEGELGVEIINRQSKEFALTEEGELVYAYAQRVLNYFTSETEALKEHFKGVGGSLSVGVPPTAGPAYFYSRIYAFRQEYPNVKLSIEETPSNTLIEKMEIGQIDMGIVLEPFENENYIKKPVYRSEIVICVAQNHSLAQKESVRLSELKNESFLMLTPDYMFRGIVDNYCRTAGFQPKVVFESSQWDMLYDMVAANFGITFLPRWLVEKWGNSEVRILFVEEPQMPWVLSLCYAKSRFMTEPMKKFLEICLRGQEHELNS